MDILNRDSLSVTLDNLNEAFFYEKPVSKSDREEVAGWLAGRQGLPGSYCGMFAPTEYDFKVEARLFTGEALNSRGGTSHILGEETCRALILLDVSENKVINALERATSAMNERLSQVDNPGVY